MVGMTKIPQTGTESSCHTHTLKGASLILTKSLGEEPALQDPSKHQQSGSPSKGLYNGKDMLYSRICVSYL